MPLLIIILKMCVCSATLFGYYRLFLRNTRFHHYNRFYLLACVLISLVLPFVNIPFVLDQTAAPSITSQAIEAVSMAWNAPTPAHFTIASWFTTQHLVIIAYACGVVLVLFGLLRSLLYIRRVKSKYAFEKINDLKLYNTGEPGAPFSFFKSIFWHQGISVASESGQRIFRHEVFHVRERHSADNLFMEIVVALCWFNPIFYLIKRELKIIHEFLADRHAVSNYDQFAYAELLLAKSIELRRSGPVHPFFHNQIKRRIAMITQLNNRKYGYWRRILVLPVTLFLFCFIAIRAQQAQRPEPQPARVTPPTPKVAGGGDTISMEQLGKLMAEAQGALTATPRGDYMEFRFSNGSTYFVRKNELGDNARRDRLREKQKYERDELAMESLGDERAEHLTMELKALQEEHMLRERALEMDRRRQEEAMMKHLESETDKRKLMQEYKMREINSELDKRKLELREQIEKKKGKDTEKEMDELKEVEREGELMKAKLGNEMELQGKLMQKEQEMKAYELMQDQAREQEEVMRNLEMREKLLGIEREKVERDMLMKKMKSEAREKKLAPKKREKENKD